MEGIGDRFNAGGVVKKGNETYWDLTRVLKYFLMYCALSTWGALYMNFAPQYYWDSTQIRSCNTPVLFWGLGWGSLQRTLFLDESHMSEAQMLMIVLSWESPVNSQWEHCNAHWEFLAQLKNTCDLTLLLCRRLVREDPGNWNERKKRMLIQSIWEVVRGGDPLEFLNLMDQNVGRGVQITHSLFGSSTVSHCADPIFRQVLTAHGWIKSPYLSSRGIWNSCISSMHSLIAAIPEVWMTMK